MIFPGASGAGKSTFSQLLATAGIGRLLSDERMVLREIGGIFKPLHPLGRNRRYRP